MDPRAWENPPFSDLCLLQPHFYTVNNLAIRYPEYSTATITITSHRLATSSQVITTSHNQTLSRPRSAITHIPLTLPRAIQIPHFCIVRLDRSLRHYANALRLHHDV